MQSVSWKCDLNGSRLELTGTLPSCSPIPCPTISSILGMERNGLLAGQLCQQTCAPRFRPVNETPAILVICDLQGNFNVSGSMPQCRQIKSNTDIVIPSVKGDGMIRPCTRQALNPISMRNLPQSKHGSLDRPCSQDQLSSWPAFVLHVLKATGTYPTFQTVLQRFVWQVVSTKGPSHPRAIL